MEESTGIGRAQSLVNLWTMLGASNTAGLLHDMKLLLTAFYTSLIVWIIGLAVPVTASYIISAVIAAPRHDQSRRAGFCGAHVHLFFILYPLRTSAPSASFALRV